MQKLKLDLINILIQWGKMTIKSKCIKYIQYIRIHAVGKNKEGQNYRIFWEVIITLNE